MPTNASEFLPGFDNWWRHQLPADVKLFGTKVCLRFVQTASSLARVRTGAMKAHIQVYVGAPDMAFDPSVTDKAPGTQLSGSRLSQSIARLEARGESDIYGVVSTAPYSVFVNQGTVRMAARPFWQAGLEAANAMVMKQSELNEGAV